MIDKMMKRFALSREGAKGLVQAIIACTVGDIALMFPVVLLYFLVSDFIDGKVSQNHYILYGIGIIAALLLIFLSEFWKYNSTYFSTYRESGKCRIRLAEKLRKLPLSFFGKKDIADLTNTMLGDVSTTEQMFSHYVPQFYGSIISTCIIAVGLFFYDWRLAIAALWVLPVALLIVGFSKMQARNAYAALQSACSHSGTCGRSAHGSGSGSACRLVRRSWTCRLDSFLSQQQVLIFVHTALDSFKAVYRFASVLRSSALVESSKIRISAGFITARAMDKCPDRSCRIASILHERRTPQYFHYSYPSGVFCTKSSA